MRKSYFLFLFILFWTDCIAQKVVPETEIYSFISSKIGLFVSEKPKPINISLFQVYSDSLIFKRRTNFIDFIPFEVQKELFEKALNQDNSKWIDEFPTNILVSKSNQTINYKAINNAKKMTLTSKLLKVEIRKFNRTSVSLREISYISRPIFSSNNEYSVIQVDRPIGNLGGGGLIMIFRKVDFQWKYLGNISTWVY